MEEGFSAGQAARLAGLKYFNLDSWATTGFITPSIATATGYGSERRYSFRDLVALRVARELREAGISLQALRRVVGRLKEVEGIEDPLSESRLVAVGDDVVWVRNEAELLSVLRRPGQTYLTAVVNLAPIVEELRERIAKAA